MQRTWKDITRALSDFRQAPAFSITVVMTLAIAIGANTTIFSMVYAMLLNQLPFEDPAKLVRIHSVMENRDSSRTYLSPLDARDLNERAETLESIGYFVYHGMSYGGQNRPMDISGNLVSPNYLTTLGARVQLGRVFDESDTGKDLVVISYGLWQRELGGRQDVLGESILLDNKPYEIIGVLTADINYPDSGINYWVQLDVSEVTNRRSRYLWGVGRLADGATLSQAQAELTLLADQIEVENSESNEAIGATAESLLESVAGSWSTALWLLMGVVAFVLLIACANVANMLLSRGTARTRELGVRVALGASRFQIVRMLLTEALLFALIAGLIGTLLAYAAMDVLVGALINLDMPRAEEVSLNLPVLFFALGLCVFSTLLAGLVPALRVSQVNVTQCLKSAGKQAADVGSGRLRHVLSIAAVAMSLVLLVLSLLLIKSFVEVQRVDAGYSPDRVAAVQLWFGGEPEARNNFLNAILDDLEDNPGVSEAGMTTFLPLDYINGQGSREVTVMGRAEPEKQRANLVNVAGNYVQAVGMSIKAGRPLDERLNNSQEKIIWINEALAKAYFPDSQPLGEFLSLETSGESYEIVGILGDVKLRALDRESSPVVYFPNALAPSVQMNIVARGAGRGETVTEILKDAVWKQDPTQPIYRDLRLDDQREQELAPHRLYAQAVSVFAVVAVFLASVGLYSVVSYNVARRRAEFGLRGALGASRSRILMLVLRQSGLRIGLGLVIGLGISLASARILSSVLFGVSPLDPSILSLATALLAGVGLAASLVPAQKATKVEPMTALRFE